MMDSIGEKVATVFKVAILIASGLISWWFWPEWRVAAGVGIAYLIISLLVYIIYFRLAEVNLFYTFASEGYSRLVLKGENFSRALIGWENYTFDRENDNWNVIPEGVEIFEGRPVKEYQEVKGKIPINVEELLNVQGFSYSRAEKLLDQLEQLEVETLEDLEQAVGQDLIVREADGFGEAFQENIRNYLESAQNQDRKFIVRTEAVEVIERVSKPSRGERSEDQSNEDDNQEVELIPRKGTHEVARQVDPDEITDPQYEPPHMFGGLRFYGWYPLYHILEYEFSWAEVEENGKVRHYPPKESEEDVKSLEAVLLKEKSYYCEVKEAEDRRGLDLTVEVIPIMRIVNPRKAIFEVDNWLKLILNRIKAAVRDAMTKATFEQMVYGDMSVGEDIYGDLVDRGIVEYFWETYGVELKKIDVMNISPPEPYRENILAERTAEYQKQKRVVEAEAESAYKDKVYSKIEEFGGLGQLIRVMEGVEETSLASLYAVPGLEQAFRNLYGKTLREAKTEEQQQFKQLVREVIEEEETS